MYTYDNVGNILTKTVTGATTGSGTKAYTYADGTDRLVRFGDETIVYDNLGNPTTYRGQTLTWERARQLTRVTDTDGQTVDYAYDASGLRLSKTLGGIKTSFVYADGRLIRQSKSGETIDFIYGAGGIIGLTIKTGSQTKHYLFRKNLFGDVTHIYDESGATVGTYDYTVFGACTVVTDIGGIATLNPIRYRSYYYDTETQRYYLKSRYYDPETGRFVNLDDLSYLDPDTINGLNLYAYCGNNPIRYVDYDGNYPIPNIAPQVGIGVGFIKDLLAGFGGAALGASVKAFAQLSKISMYLLDSAGGGILNPAYLNAMTKATNLQYSGGLLSGLGKVAKVAGYALLAVDVGLSIYNNFNNPNLSMDRKITDSIVDVGFSVGSFFASMAIGAAIGSWIPIPIVGTIVGAVVGALVGLAVWGFQQTGLYNDLKVGFNTFVTQTIPNAWNNFVSGWNSFWSFNWAR